MSEIVEELESLLIEWEAGTLDETGVARVREILRSDTEAREVYLRTQMVDAALKLESDAGLGIADGVVTHLETSEMDSSQVRLSRRAADHVLRISYRAAIAASVLFAVMAARLVYLQVTRTDNVAQQSPTPGAIVAAPAGDAAAQREEATAIGVALVTRLVDVEWDGGQAPLEVGDALSARAVRD